MLNFRVCARALALAVLPLLFSFPSAGQELSAPASWRSLDPTLVLHPRTRHTAQRSGPHAPATMRAGYQRPFIRSAHRYRLPDFNRQIYYKNKKELSLEDGWLPINIPFVFDFLVNSAYTTWPLRYTLQPNILSVRWELDNIWGWKFLRGSTDFSFSAAYTDIPRGAETRYFAYDYGIRRNFIPRRWRVVPYVEGRGGIGNINAKGPDGVLYAQGQDLSFTLMVGSGARYNFSPKYGVSAGVTYMHISNFYLSEPRYENFGINVYGPIVGIYMRLGKGRPPLIR